MSGFQGPRAMITGCADKRMCALDEAARLLRKTHNETGSVFLTTTINSNNPNQHPVTGMKHLFFFGLVSQLNSLLYSNQGAVLEVRHRQRGHVGGAAVME